MKDMDYALQKPSNPRTHTATPIPIQTVAIVTGLTCLQVYRAIAANGCSLGIGRNTYRPIFAVFTFVTFGACTVVAADKDAVIEGPVEGARWESQSAGGQREK